MATLCLGDPKLLWGVPETVKAAAAAATTTMLLAAEREDQAEAQDI